MSHYNRSIIYSFLILTLGASADVEIKPHDEHTAGRIRPLSEEYRQYDRDDLRGMTAERLGKMTLQEPLLRHAYMSIFLRNLSEPDTLEPEEAVIFEDMRSRGDDITPLLLDLAKQNQDSIFESALLGDIASVGGIDLNPYVEYSRTLLRERSQTINSTIAECASMLLADHGSKQDIALLKQVMAERPYLARGVGKSLKGLKRRLERMKLSKQISRPKLRGEVPGRHVASDGFAGNSIHRPVANRNGNIHPRPWMIFVFSGITIATILVWRWKSKERRL